MYASDVRARAIAELRGGASLRSVSARTGINRSTLREWLRQPLPRQRASDCPRCSDAAFPSRAAYLYLLGLYLGDGYIAPAARTTVLRIACADSYPHLMNQCEQAMRTVSGGRPVFRTAAAGCHQLSTQWKHWPCLIPQHGPGRKHERTIALTDWQLALLGQDPRPLVAGLLHSDGCRAINTVHRNLPSGARTYVYPRYFLTNESADIRGIFTDALDLLGIAWRQNRHNSISVARAEAVAALDAFVGPKA